MFALQLYAGVCVSFVHTQRLYECTRGIRIGHAEENKQSYRYSVMGLFQFLENNQSFLAITFEQMELMFLRSNDVAVSSPLSLALKLPLHVSLEQYGTYLKNNQTHCHCSVNDTGRAYI